MIHWRHIVNRMPLTMLTHGQRILKTGRIAGRQVFHWKKVHVTPAMWEQCSRLQQSRWCSWFFCSIHHSNDSVVFNRVDNPQHLPLLFGRSEPPSNNCSFGPPKSVTQTASWSIHPCCTAHERDQQTDRQTDRQTNRPRYSVCSNRPHLATAALWPNNKYSIYIVPSSPGIHRLHMI